MKPSTTNKVKGLRVEVMDEEEMKPLGALPRKGSTKNTLTYLYAIGALFLIALFLKDRMSPSGEYRGRKTEGKQSLSVRHSQHQEDGRSAVMSVDAQVVVVEGNFKAVLDASVVANFEIESNRYNLSKESIAEQLRTAKVSSLKNRVKRFACWHSCFGQFRKKAFRTLYGSAIPLFPSAPKLDAAENKEKKREAVIEVSEKGASENNELGEGEDKMSLEPPHSIHDVNSKLNATDFFKLKTKVVPGKQEGKLKANSNITPSSSTARVDTPRKSISKENSRKNENKNSASTKVAAKEEPARRKQGSKSSKTVKEAESESEDDGEYNAEEDEEESDSPEATDDDAASASEELTEDKGDGIDKKDLEDEDRR